MNILNYVLGSTISTISGLSGLYHSASYPIGEKCVNGRPVLVLSPMNYEGTNIPVHGDNFARGFLKVQSDFYLIFLFSLATAGVTQFSPGFRHIRGFRTTLIQSAIEGTTSYLFGMYLGNRPCLDCKKKS